VLVYLQSPEKRDAQATARASEYGMQWSAELGRKYELQRQGTGGYKWMLQGN
jgi:hypothetical protein